jgi:hypothetical protein
MWIFNFSQLYGGHVDITDCNKWQNVKAWGLTDGVNLEGICTHASISQVRTSSVNNNNNNNNIIIIIIIIIIISDFVGTYKRSGSRWQSDIVCRTADILPCHSPATAGTGQYSREVF